MSKASLWHIHLQGETIGPIPASAVQTMLKQGRLQATEFAWTDGQADWKRILEFPELCGELPSHPKIPVPHSGKAVTESREVPAPASVPMSVKHETARTQEVKNDSKAESAKQWPSRRRAPRFAIQGELVTSEGLKYSTVNFSENGVFLKAKELLPIGTDVKFRLSLEGIPKALELTGIVIRHGEADGERGFAIEFTRINPSHRRTLQELVLSKSKG